MQAPHKQAGHVTAPDQCCSDIREFLPRRRPHVAEAVEKVARTSCIIRIGDDRMGAVHF